MDWTAGHRTSTGSEWTVWCVELVEHLCEFAELRCIHVHKFYEGHSFQFDVDLFIAFLCRILSACRKECGQEEDGFSSDEDFPAKPTNQGSAEPPPPPPPGPVTEEDYYCMLRRHKKERRRKKVSFNAAPYDFLSSKEL